MKTAPQPAGATRYMQGIAVPEDSVNPDFFFAKTRRHTYLERQVAYTGQLQDVFELRKSDILSTLKVRFSGQVVITPGTGTVATSARWPYDLLRQVRFTANGASNIINVSGCKLKIRDIMKRDDLTDRGVTQTFGGVSRTQGTLALAGESWGVGASTANLAAGTYSVELVWDIPISEDEKDLAGAIFLATSTSDLTLTLDYEQMANLFVLTGTATAVLTGNVQVISTKFSIPIGPDGQIVIPNLNMFHSLIQGRYTQGLANGENEIRLVGQGAGKQLLRVYYQVFNGATTASAPLPMTTPNFGKQSWRYGNNETPDEFIDGNHMRFDQERRYGSDVGGLWGVGCHDFTYENAFRDAVDMGTTSELRLVSNIQSSVALTTPAVEYVTETVFLAGQAA